MIWNILGKQAVRILLPVTFTQDTMYGLIDALLDKNYDCKHEKILLDFQNLNKIQVGGIVLLSNLIEASRKAGVNVKLANSKSCKAANFLDGSGFNSQYVDKIKSSSHKLTDEFMRLQLVEYERSRSYLSGYLIPWISEKLDAEPRALATVKVCFEEIFNNIQDHSTVNVGCSCAHFDHVTKTISICISDIGVGIPHNVRANMKINSDSAAIAMACQQGFTTRSSPRNMGAGLYVLITNIVKRNSGTVKISSGYGIYTSTNDGIKVKSSGRQAKSSYPGTLIYITLSAKTFVPDETEEKFEWELSEF